MPGQRAPGQRPILIAFDEGFLHDIAFAMRRSGYSDRSKFIRDAVYEKLIKLKIPVDYKKAMAPTRLRAVTEVRGHHNHVYQNVHLNEEPPPYGGKKKRKKK